MLGVSVEGEEEVINARTAAETSRLGPFDFDPQQTHFSLCDPVGRLHLRSHLHSSSQKACEVWGKQKYRGTSLIKKSPPKLKSHPVRTRTLHGRATSHIQGYLAHKKRHTHLESTIRP